MSRSSAAARPTRALICCGLVALVILTFSAGSLATAAGTPATVSLSPAASHVSAGQEFDVSIRIDNPVDLRGVSLVLNYNPDVLQIVSISDNAAFWGGSDHYIGCPFICPQIDNTGGRAQYDISIKGSPGVSASGIVATVHLRAQANGLGRLTLSQRETTLIAGETLSAYPAALMPAYVVVGRASVYLPLGVRLQ